jgi:hypothetical protein
MSLLFQLAVTRPLAPGTCLFVYRAFRLTRQPIHGSLSELSRESAGKRQAALAGERERDPASGKKARKCKKDVISRERTQSSSANKVLSGFGMLKTNWFFAQTNPKRTQKRTKKPPLMRKRTGIRESKAAARQAGTGGLHELRI